MLAGELYMATDAELVADTQRAAEVTARFNQIGDTAVLGDLLGSLGEGTIIRPAFRCDYGSNTFIGARCFVNFDCVFLDCNRITIGDEVLIAPGVHIYTATHPLDAATRREGLEYALPIHIGDGVWLGGRSVICPGVTIGENTVVAAGAVVTTNLPAGVVAAGVPARITRTL